jgi:hypothetical protein
MVIISVNAAARLSRALCVFAKRRTVRLVPTLRVQKCLRQRKDPQCRLLRAHLLNVEHVPMAIPTCAKSRLQSEVSVALAPIRVFVISKSPMEKRWRRANYPRTTSAQQPDNAVAHSISHYASAILALSWRLRNLVTYLSTTCVNCQYLRRRRRVRVLTRCILQPVLIRRVRVLDRRYTRHTSLIRRVRVLDRRFTRHMVLFLRVLE